jgi:hypothetical protein
MYETFPEDAPPLTVAEMTELGIQPPELDGWPYFDEREK